MTLARRLCHNVDGTGLVAVSDLEDWVASLAQPQGVQPTALSQDNPEEPRAVLGQILDLSTSACQRRTFGRYAQDPRIGDRIESLAISASHKEVLVPWRGELPRWLFERIDVNTGLLVLGA